MIKFLWMKISHPRVLEFYKQVLGFKVVNEQISQDKAVYFLKANEKPQQTQLVLELNQKATFKNEMNPGYWKIGLTLQDLDLAYEIISKKYKDISEPKQFLDIGYLCHLRDPDGNTIELLQYDFKDQNTPLKKNTNHTLLQPFNFAHISLRITDPIKSSTFYSEKLGLKLMGKIQVKPYQFSLYFFGYTAEVPLHIELESVENRPWLWRRAYTLIELQHYWHDEKVKYIYSKENDETLGFTKIVMESSQLKKDKLHDPDGCPIEIL